MALVHSRRQFLATLPAFAAFAQSKPLNIEAVEIWEFRGHGDSVRGVDQQYQVNPLHIYDELRPKPYADAPRGTESRVPVSALYLKIKTDGGAEGLYGPIDPEVAIVVDEAVAAVPDRARTRWRRRSYGTSSTARTGTRAGAIS